MKPPPWAVIPAVSITLPEPYDDRSGGATGRGLAIGGRRALEEDLAAGTK